MRSMVAAAGFALVPMAALFALGAIGVAAELSGHNGGIINIVVPAILSVVCLSTGMHYKAFGRGPDGPKEQP